MRAFDQTKDSSEQHGSANRLKTRKPSAGAIYQEHPILRLQHTVGNRAANQLLQSHGKPTLKVTRPTDASEEKADRIAEGLPQRSALRQKGIRAEGDYPDEDLRHDRFAGLKGSLKEPPIGLETIDASLIREVLRSPGKQLPPASRAIYETRLGYDFRQVRIHTGTVEDAAATAMNARAFTLGRDIAFGAGQFQAGTHSGRMLLAHELAHVVQQGNSNAHAPGVVVQRAVTDPIAPVRTQFVLTAGVGSSRPNNVSDVRLIQDRLLDLQYISAADHTAETPAAGTTGAIPEANLAATIAAIRLFQTEVLGHASPDGAVDAGGATLRRLNSAVTRQTAAQMTDVTTARTSITETVTRGVAIAAAVGRQSNANVIAGTVNRPADVGAVQTRLVQLRHLTAAHGEIPTGVAVVAPIVLSAGVGRARPNKAADVRSIQNRLLALSHLSAADHAAEFPAAGVTGAILEAALTATIAAIDAFQAASGFGSPDGAVDLGGTTLGFLNTDSVPSQALRRTRNAIRRFQDREVEYWRSRGVISGSITNEVIHPGDATITLLNRISGYREQFTTGEDIRFRDFSRSQYTRNVHGTSFLGTSAPSALPAAEYTAIGLTPVQTNALRFVSAHEGNFDALNTYDRARVSFGFIQFAGGRGLPPFMALLKSREPAVFASMFQTFGIDVEFNVVGGQIQNAALVVLDPATNTILRGTTAEEAIRDSQRLSTVFIRAGRNIDVQRVQIETATRDYILPSLGRQATFNADIVEVLSAPGGAVTATHAGAAARAFRTTPAFTGLSAAGRIRQRRLASREGMENLLASEQGVAVLMDRAIQEGVGGGAVRLKAAMRFIADRQGLTDIARVSAFEQDVIQQVVDDLTADIDIATHIDRARAHLRTLHRAAGAAGATVAGILARPQAASARTEINNAITALPRKSPGSSRTNLGGHLPAQRVRLNFTPAPANIGALRNLLADIRDDLNQHKPKAGNARSFRVRVQAILGSALAAPGAPAPAPAPAPSPAPTPAPALTPAPAPAP